MIKAHCKVELELNMAQLLKFEFVRPNKRDPLIGQNVIFFRARSSMISLFGYPLGLSKGASGKKILVGLCVMTRVFFVHRGENSDHQNSKTQIKYLSKLSSICQKLRF